MIGKPFNEFMNDIYISAEIEFAFQNTKYLLNSYIDDNAYVLTIDSIEENSKNIFFIHSTSRQERYDIFTKARVFNEKTIYEAEQDIEVLYG